MKRKQPYLKIKTPKELTGAKKTKQNKLTRSNVFKGFKSVWKG